MSRRTLLFALDLIDDPELIAEYETHHSPGGVWPEVVREIRAQGVRGMQIWRTGNRLVMIADIDDDYPREHDRHPMVDAWEELMWKFQQALPHAKSGEKWIPMTKIFDLAQHERGR